jgi:outer membrane protein assembly factor BamA
VEIPQGIFHDSQGNPITLTPFTVPFGGNALAVVNIEGRIPISNALRVVPFYDGGNVFTHVKDLFHPSSAPANDTFQQNLRATWSHTVGLGLRVKTPIGGEFGVDYGFLLNPPQFLIPQPSGPDAVYRLRQGHLHFRFSQAF